MYWRATIVYAEIGQPRGTGSKDNCRVGAPNWGKAAIWTHMYGRPTMISLRVDTQYSMPYFSDVVRQSFGKIIGGLDRKKSPKQ